jgi:tetratricopeptide (TPR) repeat protein
VLNTLLDRLRTIDRRLILSGVLALIAATLLLLLATAGPPESRLWSALALILLLVVVQVILLFFRPPDRSAFGQAREAFMAGDYASAADQLEKLTAIRPSARGYTLLGNTYRQLGRMQDSRTAIDRALSFRANDAYALYGRGRLELALGNFEEAAEWFDRALKAGAPGNVACDLGYAEYFLGNLDAAARTLHKTTRIMRLEPYRVYLTNAILYGMLRDKSGEAGRIALANLKQAAGGAAYWEAEIARHPDSTYAAKLRAVLDGAKELVIE